MSTTILLVDDHPIFRQGIASLISMNPRYKIVGEAPSRRTALELARSLKPHLILLDLTLGEENGLELLKDLQIFVPESRVLILSMHDEAVYAERALAAGAVGYVEKNQASDLVLEAMETVLSGKRWFSPQVKERLVDSLWNADRRRTINGVAGLSDRELEVFTLMGKGMGTSRIATQLNLSVRTIETYQDHLKQKLGCAGNQELRIRAADWNAKS